MMMTMMMMMIIIIIIIKFIDVLTQQPDGQFHKEHKYGLRDKSQLHTIYI